MDLNQFFRVLGQALIEATSEPPRNSEEPPTVNEEPPRCSEETPASGNLPSAETISTGAEEGTASRRSVFLGPGE